MQEGALSLSENAPEGRRMGAEGRQTHEECRFVRQRTCIPRVDAPGAGAEEGARSVVGVGGGGRDDARRHGGEDETVERVDGGPIEATEQPLREVHGALFVA